MVIVGVFIGGHEGFGFFFRIGPEGQSAQGQKECHFDPVLSLKHLNQSNSKKDDEYRKIDELICSHRDRVTGFAPKLPAPRRIQLQHPDE